MGRHPVLDELRRDAAELGLPDWSPERFVEVCVRDDLGSSADRRRIQLREWQLLFHHCGRASQ